MSKTKSVTVVKYQGGQRLARWHDCRCEACGESFPDDQEGNPCGCRRGIIKRYTAAAAPVPVRIHPLKRATIVRKMRGRKKDKA